MDRSIGILHISNQFEHSNNIGLLIEKTLNEQHFSFIDITEKEQVERVDGLIINIENSSDYVKAFQWLIDLEDNHSLFIWVLCKDKESELIKLYPHLSKNSVIDIVERDEEKETLGIAIKNAMNYKDHLLKGAERTNTSSSHFLDPLKLSLTIHNESIALTRIEFKLIQLLYENIENVVTYKEINNVIYGDTADEKTAKYKLANIIFHIRNKLKEQTYFEIEIIRTKGYLLTCSEND